jgi:hypothetical protein
VTGSTCNADGASGGSYANGIVSGLLNPIGEGGAATLVFRVSVK